MKGGVAMLVTALIRLATAEPPPGDVLLMLTSDEEAGSRTGMKFLVEKHPDLFDGVRYALSEFGGFTQWHGKRRFVPIQVAEKQRCVIRATARGQGGHAASVVRGTASAKLGKLLSRLASRRLPVHVTPIARSMVEATARALPLHERVTLHTLLVPALTDRTLDLLGSAARPLDPLLHNTATATVVRGGNATNVIPTELSVDLDGRTLPGMSAHHLLAELDVFARGLAAFELVHEEPAATAKPDLELFPLLADVVRRRDPGCIPIPTLLAGYTDARYVSKLDIQTYGFLPLRLPSHVTAALIHAADERVPAEAAEFGVACLLDVVSRYRGQ
jgi:acetylornithine deacetylase/succinyl-diaminopimelate desuccinylase-like protein